MTSQGSRHADVSLVVSVFRSERYIRRFANTLRKFAADLESFPELKIEIIAILNSPSPVELRVVQGLESLDFAQLHIRTAVVPRETIYASWNRGIHLAQGNVLGFWNVDDARYVGAIAEAAEAIASGARLVYSPFYFDSRWRKWGLLPRRAKVLVDPPAFDSDVFRRKFLIGPFFVFSRELYEAAGPFDEQFQIAGDLEWGLRALDVASFSRAASVSGVHLNEFRGLSTSGSERVFVEQNVIHTRHGMLDLLQPGSDALVAEYDAQHLIVAGKRERVSRPALR